MKTFSATIFCAATSSACPSVDHSLQSAMVARALAFRGEDLARLLHILLPGLRMRAARVLARHRRTAAAAGIELGDAVQETVLRLLEHDAAWLRAWNPERGMALHSWVGLLCERALRSKLLRRAEHIELAVEPATHLEPSGVDPLHHLEARAELSRVVRELEESGSARALELVQRLCLAEEPAEQVAARLGMTRAAVYAARSRLTKQSLARARSPLVPRQILATETL